MKKSLLLVMVFFLLLVLVNTRSIAHAQDDQNCSKIILLFARGSGQTLDTNDRTEMGRFLNGLQKKIESTTTVSTYPLGNRPYGNSQYPAISVNPWEHLDNLFGAWASKGQLYEYGKSVDTGVDELTSFLSEKSRQCPTSQFVLGGYSQGAQVVGQALPLLTKDIRNKIIFAALFGDPKLNLPEGRGFNPPACRHEQYSSYRREVPDCNTDNGSLGIREPYLPGDMLNKVGLWCNDDDLVCGSSKIPWINDGHGKYANDNGAIENATDEISQRINKPPAQHNIFSMFDDVFPKSPDIMLVLDNSTNMSSQYYTSFIKPFSSLIASTTVMSGGRIGLETYAGCNARSNFKNNFTHPTTNADMVLSKINSTGLYPPSCDLAQDLANTVEHAKNHASWREGVPHLIIVLTTSPFSTYLSPAEFRLSEALYVVTPRTSTGTYSNKRIDESEVIALNSEDFDALFNSPNEPYLNAVLDGPNINATPDTDLQFSAKQTIVENDAIVGYDWDFNGDSVYEATTTEPQVNYTYTIPYAGQLALRVRTLRGLEQVVTQDVIIEYKESRGVPKAPNKLTIQQTSDSTALLQWRSTDTLADSWIILIDDMPLGRVNGSQSFLNISGIRDDEKKLIFTVKAVTKDWAYGDPASVLYVKESSSIEQEQSLPFTSFVTSFKKEASKLGQILGVQALGIHFGASNTPAFTPFHPGISHSKSSVSDNFLFFIGGFLAIVAIGIVVTISIRKAHKKH